MNGRRVRKLTVTQAADRLGVHEQTIRRWVRAGLLRAFSTPSYSKFGKRYRIAESEIRRFEERHRVGPDAIEAPQIEGVRLHDEAEHAENLY